MPRKGKSTRKIPVDLVDLVIRNRKLIQPYDLRQRSKKELDEQESESIDMDNNDSNKQMDTRTTNVNDNQEEKIQQEPPQGDPQSEPQLPASPKSTCSQNLDKKSSTNNEDVKLNIMEEVTEQEQLDNLENPESQPTPTSKKMRLQEAATEKKPNSRPRLQRKGTPRPSPRTSPKTTPNPTRTKLRKRISRRSEPCKTFSKRAKWRTSKSSQTKSTQLRTNCKSADSASITSGSRLYLAEVALQNTRAPRRLSDNSHLPKRLLTMQETESTVILHRNPNFKVKGARRSNQFNLRRQYSNAIAKESPTMTQKKKQQTNPKPQVLKNSTPETHSCSNSSDSTAVNSKSTTEDSNSYDGNVVETFSETIMGVVGERKDQELRPPPPPPMLPHMAPHSCSLNCYPQLAEILQNMDNFLKTVTKAAPSP